MFANKINPGVDYRFLITFPQYPIPNNTILDFIFGKKAGFSAISNGFITKNHRSPESFW